MVLQLPLSQAQLTDLNAFLSPLLPDQILEWATHNLPNLYQTTAFGLTGLVAIDMLSAITPSPPPLIFLDTLYHFPETLALVERVKRKYGIPVHVYRPEGADTPEQFEEQHGYELWVADESRYDYLVKVEPARRAYQELNVQSVITGRRSTQGGARKSLQPLEVDSTGLVKLNPFFAWSFAQVNEYIAKHNVPRNDLLDQGYKSVGDWHSTQPVANDEDGERAGRWAGRQKT
ncbi:phosophoadenylyl-sulfate reductase, partial [Sistotremastrum niveocremeum HHB9708]